MEQKSRQVILVDSDDKDIGALEKLKAHREGRLHRAFSVFIFNSRGELLVQERALSKYHSGGLIANTCCSHPGPGEDTIEAAEKRLFEEIGIRAKLHELFSFKYKARLGNSLIEHEFDHVLAGYYDGEPRPSPDEVKIARWESLDSIRKGVSAHPDRYAYWFKEIFEKHYNDISAAAAGKDTAGAAGRACPPSGCPICSREGLLLMLAGLLMFFLLPRQWSWLGILPVLAAYMIPLVRMAAGKK